MSNTSYLSLIDLAKQTLREGDRTTTKKVAQYIVAHHPDGLEGWLLLGGLSSPENSLVYLNIAKEIAPNDPRVKAALAWAKSNIVAPSDTIDPVQIHLKDKSAQPKTAFIAPPLVIENRYLVWVWTLIFILVLAFVFLGMGAISLNPNRVSSNFSLLQSTSFIKPTQNSTNTIIDDQSSLTPIQTLTPTPTSTPTPTPTIVPNLYGCNMEIRFLTGPLEEEGTTFSMLDESYFYDKGDKFEPGKNTGLFYEEPRYLILHSGYQGSNILTPLEIEFVRNYLEQWGNNGQDYIEEQIQNLKGSEMVWICDGQEILETRLVDVARLSHEASHRLWLEPRNLFQILDDREGSASEWIGDIDHTNISSVYLGFCGWGPPEIVSGRSIYYRYILRFEILI
ncbi:hypothetical protein KKA69_06400 [Patescibacteria group bacterium]|nr:hypothetical protein [Patescibacteria group bacterium]